MEDNDVRLAVPPGTARHRGFLGADPAPEAAAPATPPQCRHGIADPGCQGVRGRAGIPRWRRPITALVLGLRALATGGDFMTARSPWAWTAQAAPTRWPAATRVMSALRTRPPRSLQTTRRGMPSASMQRTDCASAEGIDGIGPPDPSRHHRFPGARLGLPVMSRAQPRSNRLRPRDAARACETRFPPMRTRPRGHVPQSP